MCDRYLRGLPEVPGPDADEGPEGPPVHAQGALVVDR
jgi:hypothetical protein